MPDGDSSLLNPPAQPEPMSVCPLCLQKIATREYSGHLAAAHRLYTHRGVCRSLIDTIDAIRDDLLISPDDPSLWRALEQLSPAEQLPEMLTLIAEQLTGEQIPLAAPHIPKDASLVNLWAQSKLPTVRLLALLMLPNYANMPNLRRVGRVLVSDLVLPEEQRIATVAQILTNLGETSAALKLLGALLEGQTKARGVQLLHRVQQITGPLPAIDVVLNKIEPKLRVRCPQCNIELTQNELPAHLWTQHQLLLEGKTPREPWHVLEDWLMEAKTTRDRIWVDRCRVAVRKLNSPDAALRLDRLLAVNDLLDDHSRQILLDSANQLHACRCPWCWANVPLPKQEPVLLPEKRDGKWSIGEYRVQLRDRGVFSRVEVVTPTQLIYRGQEPGYPWTRKGAAYVYSGILVLVSLIMALIWPVSLGGPIRPVLAMLFLAAILWWGVWRFARRSGTFEQRVSRLIWGKLVPNLHVGGFNSADSRFLCGVVFDHLQRGDFELPKDLLDEMIGLTTNAVEAGQGSAAHLAALVRLRIEIARVSEQQDPILLVVKQVSRCFQGTRPLLFAQALLDEWDAEFWTPANIARARVLLCDAAFEAGLEVQNLLDAGRNAPALGAILNVESPRKLAALRLLWSLRPTRPWDKLGAVWTAYDLAADINLVEAFTAHPDVLLLLRDEKIPITSKHSKEQPLTIQFTQAGVWVQEMLYNIPPGRVEVRRGGRDLVVGQDLYRGEVDLSATARRIELWFRWVFKDRVEASFNGDFFSRLDDVLRWQSPQRAQILSAWGALQCPECGKNLLARVGEVGIAVTLTDRPTIRGGKT
jgi:hypothetical protein